MNSSSGSNRRVGVVMLHGACAMSCLFCITENFIEEMKPEQVSYVLRLIKEREMESVVFGGGEPLQWRYSLADAIREAKSLGLLSQVGTNGVGLTPERVQNLNADRYVLPLDSIKPATHDYLRRGHKWHYALIQNRFEYLRMEKIAFTVSTVVCRMNLMDLEKIAEFLLALYNKGANIHAWHLYKFLPFGRNGKPNEDVLKISDEEYRLATDKVKSMHLPFYVFKRPNMQLSRDVDFFWYEKGSLKIGSHIWRNKPILV